MYDLNFKNQPNDGSQKKTAQQVSTAIQGWKAAFKGLSM